MSSLWRRTGGDRRIAESDPPLTPQCIHCHKPDVGRPRIIVGVGLRTLCEPCERRMTSMGYEVREDRRGQ